MGMAGASAPQAALLAHPGSCCIQLKPQGMCSSPGSPPLLTIPSWLPALFQDWMNPRMELWVARRVSSPHPSHRNPLESAPCWTWWHQKNPFIHPKAATCSRMFPQSCIAWGAVPAFHSACFPLAILHLLVFPLILPCKDGSESCSYPLSRVLIIPCSFLFTLKEPQPLLHALNLQLCYLRLGAF